MSGGFEHIQMMSMCTCGQIMITLQSSDLSITFLCEEGSDNPRMGIKSHSGDIDDLLNLVEELVAIWKEMNVSLDSVYLPKETIAVI